eukprot:9100210-Pyramimonas_sp.AAC.1
MQHFDAASIRLTSVRKRETIRGHSPSPPSSKLARAEETAVEVELVRPTTNVEHRGGETLTDECGMR